jgi:hypothetical protein
VLRPLSHWRRHPRRYWPNFPKAELAKPPKGCESRKADATGMVPCSGKVKKGEMDLLIYVMHPNKTLYCGDKKKCRFHHSSFLAGGTTVAAGSLLVDQGKLVRLTPHSGHCAPPSHLPLAARCAQGGGACLVARPL